MNLIQEIAFGLLCSGFCMGLEKLVRGFKYIWVVEFGNKWSLKFWK